MCFRRGVPLGPAVKLEVPGRRRVWVGIFGVDMIDDWDDVDVFGWTNPKGIEYWLMLQQKLAPNCLPFYRWVDKRTGGFGHATSDWQKAMDDGREYLKRQETR